MKSFIFTLLFFASFQSYAAEPVQNVNMRVTEKGFEPSEFKVKAGSHVVLKVTRTTDATCATSMKFQEKNMKKELPLNKEVSIDLGKVKQGEIKFACGMDMITGHIVAQ